MDATDLLITEDRFDFSAQSLTVQKRAVSKKRSLPRMPRMQGQRFVDAGKTDTLTAGWQSFNYSPDSIIYGHMERVRARSRQLEMNDPYVKRFLRLADENVVGSRGINLKMRVIERFESDGSIVQDERANSMIETAWKRWGKRRTASRDKMDSFVSIQKLALKACARDGEVFIRKHRDRRNPFSFSLEVIEADLVPYTLNKKLSRNRYVHMGIEYNQSGEKLAYHMLESHPGELILGQKTHSQRTIRIPADNMIHLFMRERPKQTRGIPWAVTSMARSNMLDGYEQAELVAARAAASKMGFFTTDGENEYIADDEVEDANGQTQMITDFEAGIFESLPHGVDFKPFDPQHPSGNFEPFTKRILRGISSGLGIGYNTMANDYEGVNFSSLRQSNLSERDYWRCLQQWLIEQLHEEIFVDWLEMAMLSGEINLPVSRLDKFDAAIWCPRGWSWVDPVKEMAANEKAIALNLDSASNIAAQQGMDYEQILQDKANEKRLREKYGVEDITDQSASDMLDTALQEQLKKEEQNAPASNNSSDD